MLLSGRRAGPRWLNRLGVVILLVSMGGIAALVATRDPSAEALAPWLGIGGTMTWWVLLMVSVIKREGTMDVDLGRVPRPLVLGRLVGPLQTRVGTTLDLGDVIVGGLGHAGRGLVLTGRARRRVDLELDDAAFTRLLARLGVVPDDDGVETLELVRNSQTRMGMLRVIVPLVVVVAVASVVSVLLASTAWGAALEATPTGRVAVPIGIAAWCLGGLVLTLWLNLRLRPPARYLVLGDMLVWRDRTREHARAPWSRVSATPSRHEVRVRSIRSDMPVCTLLIDGLEVRVGAWDAVEPWSRHAPRGRPAQWLIGGPQWPVFRDALERRGLLR